MKHVLILYDVNCLSGSEMENLPWTRFGIEVMLLGTDGSYMDDGPLKIWNLEKLEQEQFDSIKLQISEALSK